MSDAIEVCRREFVAELFTQNKDPFDPASWFSLDDRFGFANSKTRRYQIAWQASVGVAFLHSFKTPRAVSAQDQLLAVVREYECALYASVSERYSHEVVR